MTQNLELQEIFPLTPVQRFMLDIHHLTPSGLAFQQQYSYYLMGDVDPDMCRRAWEAVAARHPAMRTSFHWEGLTQPFQVVHARVRLPMYTADLRHLGPDERNAAAFGWLMTDAKEPFDPVRPPLIRIGLQRMEDQLFVMTCTMSHLIFDGWSLGVAFRHFARAYAELTRGDEPDTTPLPSLRPYVSWMKRRDMEADLAWWRKTLADAVMPRLPFMHAPASQGPVEADQIHHLVLSEEETTALDAAARDMGITMNVLYQGAWALMQSRLSEERRALMLTVAASRPVELRDIDEVFGLLIDGVPYSLHCPGDVTARAWLSGLRTLQLESLEHQHVPVQSWLTLGRHPGVIPYNSYLIFENMATGEGQEDGCPFKLQAAYMNSHLSFPLSMMVFPGPTLRVAVIYSQDHFSQAGILAFAERMRGTLTALAAHPDATLDEISALADLTPDSLTMDR